MSNVQYPKLDERLQAAADLFTACDIGADIGADHGRLSCYLLAQNRCERMIVSDISAVSLSKAKTLLEKHHLAERAVFRVADGLQALDEPASCVAICGMGGRVMAEILKTGRERLSGASLVLSCHTELPSLRRTLTGMGYYIGAERLVRAKGRYYIVLRAERGDRQYTDKELYLGPVLMRERPPLWLPYLRWRRDVVRCEQAHEERLNWIEEELNNEAADGQERI